MNTKYHLRKFLTKPSESNDENKFTISYLLELSETVKNVFFNIDFVLEGNKDTCSVIVDVIGDIHDEDKIVKALTFKVCAEIYKKLQIELPDGKEIYPKITLKQSGDIAVNPISNNDLPNSNKDYKSLF